MMLDPIRMEIFKHLFSAVAEEMGVILRKTSYSPNIKERRDFSCSVFDPIGRMVSQAAHIPVHLGSMPLSVSSAIQVYQDDLNPGDVIILNDPYQGGTHLPDITLVSPVYSMADSGSMEELVGYVANRAHHADVGGTSPGSMPLASEIYQEGLVIPPVKLVDRGSIRQELLDLILANVRTPDEREGDLRAQLAANQRGVERLKEIVSQNSCEVTFSAMSALIAYTERLVRQLLRRLPTGEFRFSDRLDNNGIDDKPVEIVVCLRISGDEAVVDFTGSADQQPSSINAVFAITLSAVHYVFRCLLGIDAPNNAGCLVPVQVIAPPGTIVNALPPSPVAGGNVETSQRIVDVLLGAFSHALPDRIPAASQGTMNNIAIGGKKPDGNQFTYYETIAGGMGARPNQNGVDAVHTHMTNTLNTPAEAMEYAYPLRILRQEIRRNSGGKGVYRGGDGIIKEIELLANCQVTLLTERRIFAPYGLKGGKSGQPGENAIIRNGVEIILPGKGSTNLYAGDIIRISTPGGGGYGAR